MNRRELLFILRFKSDAARALRATAAQLRKTGSAAGRAARVGLRAFSRALTGIGVKIKALGTRLRLAGTRLREFGGAITALGLPFAAAGAAAIKFGTDFEASLVRVETLVGVAREEVEGFGEAIGGISRVTARGPRELADALFAVTSAGARGAKALEILEGSGKAAAAGLGSTRDISLAVVSALTAFEGQNLSVDSALDTLIGTIREGNLEATELVGALGPVIAVAPQVGASFADVGASIAAFTRLGVNARVAATGLKATFNLLLKPGKQSAEAFALIGTSAQELRARIGKEGLARVLVDLVQRFESLGDEGKEALAQAIPNIRALGSVLGTAGAQGDKFIGISDSIVNGTGALDKAFERTKETAKFAQEAFGAAFERVAIALSTEILPTFTAFLGKLEGLFNKFAEAEKATKQLVAKLGLIVIVAGPIILALGLFAIAIGGLISGIGALVSIVISIGGALITFFLTPIGLIVGGLLLFTNGILRATGQSAGFLDTLKALGNGFIAFGKVIFEVVDFVVDLVIEQFVFMFNSIKTIFGSIGRSLFLLLTGSPLEALKELGEGAKTIGAGFVKSIVDPAKELGTDIAAALSATADPLGDFFGGIKDRVTGFFKFELPEVAGEGGVAAAEAVVTNLDDGLKEKLGPGFFEKFGQDFNKGIKAGFAEFKADAEDVAGAAQEAFTNFANGATEAILDFVETGKFNFEDFTRSLLRDLNRILIKLLIVKAVEAGIGAIKGAFGPDSGAAGGVAAAAQRIGGRAGAGPKTLVPAAAFAGARRFQQGGGNLGTDTIPALLSPGERVLTAAQNRAFEQERGGRGAGGSTVVNVTINGVRDIESFRRSKGQIEAAMSQALQRANARNN